MTDYTADTVLRVLAAVAIGGVAALVAWESRRPRRPPHPEVAIIGYPRVRIRGLRVDGYVAVLDMTPHHVRTTFATFRRTDGTALVDDRIQLASDIQANPRETYRWQLPEGNHAHQAHQC